MYIYTYIYNLDRQSSFPVRRHTQRSTSLLPPGSRCPLFGLLLHKVLVGGFVRAEPRQECKMLPASRRRQGVSSVHPPRCTKAFVRHLQNGHEAKWKLVLARSSRSAHAESQRAAKSQRAEAFVEAFILSILPRCCYSLTRSWSFSSRT